MGRPLGLDSKIADAFGVTRHAVLKWRNKGAPFCSADALLDWLNWTWGIRCLDNYPPRCPRLRARVRAAMKRPRVPNSGN